MLAVIGGVLIGLGASLFWYENGRVAGVSGVLSGALRGSGASRWVSAAFLLGLVAAGVAFGRGSAPPSTGSSILTVALAGLLVGFGARLGGGCTSGHGVCGISRFSMRSVVATVTFMATGVVTVFVAAHLLPALWSAR